MKIKIVNPFKKTSQRLVLDAGPEWLKWVFVKNGIGGPSVTDIGALPIAAGPEAVKEKLSSLAKLHRVRPDEVMVLVPRNEVTARNLELPSTLPAEIKKIIDLQAVKQTPYPPNEIVYDHCLLKTFQEGYSSVMLVVVHREVLEERTKLLAAAGLKPRWIALATEGSAAWAASNLKRPQADEPVAVLDVDAGHSDLLVYQGAKIIFTQGISIGSDKLQADPENAAAKLVDEVSRLFQIYRSEEIAKEPVLLALGGATGALTPHADKMAAAAGVPVRVLAGSDSFKKLMERLKSPLEWEKRLSFLPLLGMAHVSKEPLFNLLPQETAIEAALVEKGRNLFKTGILALAIFLVSIALFSMRFYSKQSYLRWLEARTAATQAEADEVRTNRARIKDILQTHDTSVRFFGQIAHLYGSIPQEIYLTELNFTKERHMELQGRARTMTDVFAFVSGLQSDKAFRSVETKRLAKRIVNDREVVDFEIDSVLSPESSANLAKLQRAMEGGT